MGENRVLFQFEKRDDLEKVVLLGPWSFDKYILILQKVEAGESVKNLSFDKVSFWVQIHGLPMLSQTMDTGKRIGSSLGTVEKVEVDERGFCLGEYMRVRVSIDALKPLCRGRLVRVGGSSKLWVTFKYERMPIFCYWCGLLDHDEKDCMKRARSNETLRQNEKQYGPWLRAGPDRSQKPQLVLAMENRRDGSPAAETGRERPAATKPGDQLAVYAAKPMVTGVISDVVNHGDIKGG